MSFITDLFSGGASTLIDSVGKVLDGVITTKEEKQQLDIELIKSEQQFQTEMRRLGNEEKALILGDVANARGREVQVQSSEFTTKLTKNVTNYLSLGTVFLTFSLFTYLIVRAGKINPDTKDVILYILGVLSAVLSQIYSYYFGSSAGSSTKDRTIAGLKGN